MFTVNDAAFNEVVRGIYGEVGRMLAEKTDIMDLIAKYWDFRSKPSRPPKSGSVLILVLSGQ